MILRTALQAGAACYTVKSGDSNQTTIDPSQQTIYPGQKLVIPECPVNFESILVLQPFLFNRSISPYLEPVQLFPVLGPRPARLPENVKPPEKIKYTGTIRKMIRP